MLYYLVFPYTEREIMQFSKRLEHNGNYYVCNFHVISTICTLVCTTF